MILAERGKGNHSKKETLTRKAELVVDMSDMTSGRRCRYCGINLVREILSAQIYGKRIIDSNGHNACSMNTEKTRTRILLISCLIFPFITYSLIHYRNSTVLILLAY